MAEPKRRPALFHRIQTRLIVTFSLLFVVVLTTVELTSIWGVPFTQYAGRTGQEEARTFRELGLIADLKKSQLQDVLAELARDARMFADNDIVRINVARLRAATRKATSAGLTGTHLRTLLRWKESYHVLADYLHTLSTVYDTFAEINIVDAKTGTVLVSLDKEDEGRSAAQEAFFAGAIQSRGGFLGDVDRCPLVGLPTLCFGRAIMSIDLETLDEKPGVVAAVLMLDVNVEEVIAPMLHTGEGLGKTGEALLVNQRRRIITSLKHPLADGTLAKPLEHEILTQPAVLAAQGAEGIIEAEDYRGVSVLAAYRHIRVTPEWGWGLVVKCDTSELFAPLRQDIAYSVAIGLVGTLAILGMTVYLARNLTRPIAALSRTAERVADGDRSARATVIGSDEVAGLATTFNAMLHRIENWHTELKGQVQSRTAALDSANEGLKAEITQRKRVEEELRKLSVAVEQSPASIIITDTNGTIEYVNPMFTKVTEYTKEEAIGRNPRILQSKTWPKKTYERLWKTILAGKTWRGEFENKKKNGELHWELASISPVRNAEGKVTHFLAVTEDITERRRREQELREAKEAADAANKSKSEFLANMSHEIRTPMTAMLGFIDQIDEGCAQQCGYGSEQLHNHLATISRNADLLLRIINDILDVSKIEAGKMAVRPIACQPCEMIADVASLMGHQAEGKGLTFDLEYLGPIPETIQTDPTRLRQILINLLGNAIKFTETGGVRLVTRFVRDARGDREGNPKALYMQFDVVDTGAGMTKEQAAKLFQPFTQADASTTRKFGGTGLGLVISKRFAGMLGGDITVVETREGVGTRFRVTIAGGPLDGVKMLDDPMSATVVAHGASKAATGIDASGLRGCRILLAEDGPDNQTLIALILRKAGADVTVKENGKLAVDAALAAMNRSRTVDPKHSFDIILMDMQMPVMDGYEATSLLRQKGYTAPIIALTAHTMEGDREKCIEAGCDDYASKPIQKKKLIETIRQRWVGAEVVSEATT